MAKMQGQAAALQERLNLEAAMRSFIDSLNNSLSSCFHLVASFTHFSWLRAQAEEEARRLAAYNANLYADQQRLQWQQ